MLKQQEFLKTIGDSCLLLHFLRYAACKVLLSKTTLFFTKKNTNLPVMRITYYFWLTRGYDSTIQRIYTSGVQCATYEIVSFYFILTVVPNSNKFTSGQFFIFYNNSKHFLNLVYWGLRENVLKMLH